MSEIYSELVEIKNQIRKVTDLEPEIGIVLGSGLGEFAETIEKECVIEYKDINKFPVTTNKGHKGRFIFGKMCGKDILIMQGRIHYYEGYTMQEVVLPIRIMKMLGCDKVILTNAAGGISEKAEKGSLMMITDHITSFVKSPLIGENVEELGLRFPDMTHVYNIEFQEVIRKAAGRIKIDLKQGVYLQTTGPNYETPAEINLYGILGADAVGMSTACEAMAANHMGMKVCGISCITNKAAGIEDVALDDEDVKITANKVSNNFKQLLEEIIKEM